MRVVDLIARKRQGEAMTNEEITYLIRGYTAGEIPDYQMSAWLMAVVFQGMTKPETADLTMAMAYSGETLDLSSVGPAVADKHSTGGVGDKTTLVVGPLVASAGLPVAKMSGRGLGFSGGTLDKLESIPGFKVALTAQQFTEQLKQVGLVVASQTGDLAPADGKLYALRDVTATVESLPLIAASVMSKKIAAGANVIVLDVKTGRGAFMKTEADAVSLADTMVEIGQNVGRKVSAVISDMDQPLGNAVGNALEVREAIETLNRQGPSDFLNLCLTVGAQMLLLAGKAADASDGKSILLTKLISGDAMAKFRQWVVAQGGDPRVVDNPDLLPKAAIVDLLPSPESGYISEINAEIVGLTSVLLGGGRSKKGDAVDPAVGVVLKAKVGDRLQAGMPLLTIHANDPARLLEARERLLTAYRFSAVPVVRPKLIHHVI
jgi:pyrimidine-nucleoside phosphorylase